jgi:Domain of unknown function (DUF4442)
MIMKPPQLSAQRLKWLLNWWPPFWGAGIRVVDIKPDFRYACVQMKLRWYNQNYVGVHFGGSLYAMCDPFYMLLLINSLSNPTSATNSRRGGDFIVWDKAASIEYVKPGVGTMTAEFHISDDLLNSIHQMKPNTKQLIDLTVNVIDDTGDIVAKLVKTEYIKRKPEKESLSIPSLDSSTGAIDPHTTTTTTASRSKL